MLSELVDILALNSEGDKAIEAFIWIRSYIPNAAGALTSSDFARRISAQMPISADIGAKIKESLQTGEPIDLSNEY
jgi:hypothetical protein